jgi:DNA-binding PadR family transcriptional regulator
MEVRQAIRRPVPARARQGTGESVSLLGYALLGLIRQQPASGYDLRRIFATTPMGTFRDSPGAIYPALRRLEARGLIRGRVHESSGLRQRQVFHVTAAGLEELRRWIAGPIYREDVERRLGELMLRFSFTDGIAGPKAAQEFLRGLAAELELYVRELREYFNTHQASMPLAGRLALESGVRGYTAQLEWARAGIEAYKREPKGAKR